MFGAFLTYWWLVLPAAAFAAYFVLRFSAGRLIEAEANSILREAQSGFAKGRVDFHSIHRTGTKVIDGETATLYEIDATIAPSSPEIQWSGADLFLYGIDEDGEHDPMRIGEVRQVKRWDGSSFESIKRSANQVGEQRLKLSVRFVGEAGPVRFNHNFGCFGPVFELPSSDAPALVASP